MSNSRIITGGKEYLPGATTCLSNAFATDPTINYLLSTACDPETYRPAYFHFLLHNAILNGGIISEIEDFASCGVLLPPGKEIATRTTAIQAGILSVLWNVGFSGLGKAGRELPALTSRMKAKAMGENEKYYYVVFLGTGTDKRKKGFCTKILKSYQETAQKDSLPIWMEAATEYCMRLYEKLGFVVVDNIVLGKGNCGADGKTKVGGEGLRLWGMIWRPEGYVK